MAQKTPESYLRFISKYPQPTHKIPEIGNIYVFAYLFNQTLNGKKSYQALKDEKEKKFCDFIPAVFVWRIFPNYSFNGFNLHSVPIPRRREWLRTLQRYAGDEKVDAETRAKKMLPLKNLFKATDLESFSARLVRKMKLIPVSQWSDLIEFDVNTTFRATSNEIMAKYLGLMGR